MDVNILCILAFVLGALAHRLLFGGRKEGPLEKVILDNTFAGKTVVLSINNDAYIFQMVNGRMKIVRGTTELLPMEETDGSSTLDSSSPN